MFYVLWTTLALIQLAHTEGNQNDTNNLPLSFICEDDIIKAIAEELKIVKLINENMQSNLIAFNKTINQQLDDLKKSVADIDVHITSRAAANATNVSTLSNSPPSVCQSGRNGIQLIQIQNSKLSPFLVNCIQDPQQGDDPWILIQRRRDGSVDFYRNWSDYQQGFGNLEGEFFIGLDKLHALTQSALYELWIQMETFSNETRWGRYSNFTIGDESQSYALNTLGNFSGNGGDSLLTYHAGMKFSTKDKDNDASTTLNCAQLFYGAWWYNKCFWSNLNGKYLQSEYSSEQAKQGITWTSWRQGQKSLKYVHMAIRPVKLS